MSSLRDGGLAVHDTEAWPLSIARSGTLRLLFAAFLYGSQPKNSVEADAGFALDALVAELHATVIPNLRRFPRIGWRYLAKPPQSAEALAQLAALPAGAPDALREYLHGDYLMLYTANEADATVDLLSIGTNGSF